MVTSLLFTGAVEPVATFIEPREELGIAEFETHQSALRNRARITLTLG